MKYVITDEWNLLKENFTGVSGKQVLEFYDAIHSALTRLALSKEVGVKNQFCISAAMVLFHKYLVGRDFDSNQRESQGKTLNEDQGKEKEPSELFEDIEVTYLAAFFLATKVCNCLTSLSRISNYCLSLLPEKMSPVVSGYPATVAVSSGGANGGLSLCEEVPRKEETEVKKSSNTEKPKESDVKLPTNEGERGGKVNQKGIDSNASYNNNSNSIIRPSNSTINTITMNSLNKFSLQYINHSNINNLNNQSSNNLPTNNSINPANTITNPSHSDIPSNKLLSEAFKKSLEEKIKKRELEILYLTGFDLNIDLPYIYIEKLKPYFQQYLPKSEKLVEIAYNFINDSFKLPVCLYYSPLKIALAAVYLLNHHFKVDLVDTKSGTKWYHLIDSDTNIQEIKELAGLMNSIYQLSSKDKKEKKKKSPGKAFTVALEVAYEKQGNNIDGKISFLNNKRWKVDVEAPSKDIYDNGRDANTSIAADSTNSTIDNKEYKEDKEDEEATVAFSSHINNEKKQSEDIDCSREFELQAKDKEAGVCDPSEVPSMCSDLYTKPRPVTHSDTGKETQADPQSQSGNFCTNNPNYLITKDVMIGKPTREHITTVNKQSGDSNSNSSNITLTSNSIKDSAAFSNNLLNSVNPTLSNTDNNDHSCPLQKHSPSQVSFVLGLREDSAIQN